MPSAGRSTAPPEAHQQLAGQAVDEPADETKIRVPVVLRRRSADGDSGGAVRTAQLSTSPSD